MCYLGSGCAIEGVNVLFGIFTKKSGDIAAAR